MKTLILFVILSGGFNIHAATCAGAADCKACKTCTNCSYCKVKGQTCGKYPKDERNWLIRKLLPSK